MIEIIKNKHNLKEEDINNKVVRVKALILNKKGDILLGHSHCEYQFPGGHVIKGEKLTNALKRELKEETGLIYETDNLKPIARLVKYLKDYPHDNDNSKCEIYYYEIVDDRLPNLRNTNYTLEEIEGNYKLRYIPLSIVEDVIKENILAVGDVQGIGSEMLELFETYFKKIE